MRQLHIGIAGAGLGGLCLAQGLARAGHRVEIFERDPAPDGRGQGYRLRIDADGQRALAACLAPEATRLFRHSCATRNATSRFVDRDFRVLEERRPSHWQPTRDAGDDDSNSGGDLSANRRTLREILGHGLERAIHYGMPVLDVDTDAEGATAFFADGERRRFDLLVAADGVSSRLRERWLPASAPIDTGTITLYGKTPLTAATLAQLDPALLDGPTVVFADAASLIAEPMRFRRALPELAAELFPECRLSPVDDYFYWAFIGRADRLGGTLSREVAASELARRVDAAVRDWYPAIGRLVALADLASLSARPVLMAKVVPVWASSRFTLLGDAIHAMSPAGGLGANTALSDAARLTALLARVEHPDRVIDAVRIYENDMRGRAELALRATRDAAARLLRPDDSR